VLAPVVDVLTAVVEVEAIGDGFEEQPAAATAMSNTDPIRTRGLVIDSSSPRELLSDKMSPSAQV
jgi:hypothetical protein